MRDLDRKYEDIKRIKGARWLLLWVMLAQFVCRIAVRAVVSFIPEPSEFYIRYFRYLQLGIITVVTFLVSITVYSLTAWKKTERNDAEEMRFNRFNKKYFWIIVVMAVSGQFVMSLLNLPVARIVSRSASVFVPVTVGETAAALLATAVLPGIFEEFWMRGIVLSVYERRSTVVAVAFTTIMFALLHGSLAKLPGVLFLGFVAAVITIKTNSVYAAMLYHILNNATSVLFSFIAANYRISDTITWTFAAIMVIVFAASFVAFSLIGPKTKIVRCKSEGKMLMKNILSIPVILCFVIIFLELRFVS